MASEILHSDKFYSNTILYSSFKDFARLLDMIMFKYGAYLFCSIIIVLAFCTIEMNFNRLESFVVSPIYLKKESAHFKTSIH